MRLWIWIGGLIVGMTALAIGDMAAAGDAVKGKPLYEKYCLPCHGPQGRGDGPSGQLLQPPAANFASPESRGKTDADLIETMRSGHPETAMTAWRDILDGQDFADLLAYIRSLTARVGKERN